MSAWTDHVARWCQCTACPLSSQRFRICLARGDVPCDIAFIGEAPGASEDAIGRPFEGPAGKLLDDLICQDRPGVVQRAGLREAGLRLLFANLVCCFPKEAKERGDNEPAREEVLACRPRLVELINIAQPRLIVCVGSMATEYVDHSDTVPCLDVVHPAFILARMPQAQKGMAVQKMVVQLRRAAENILSESRQPWRQWGTKYANFSQGRGLRQRIDAFLRGEAGDPVPF